MNLPLISESMTSTKSELIVIPIYEFNAYPEKTTASIIYGAASPFIIKGIQTVITIRDLDTMFNMTMNLLRFLILSIISPANITRIPAMLPMKGMYPIR